MYWPKKRDENVERGREGMTEERKQRRSICIDCYWAGLLLLEPRSVLVTVIGLVSRVIALIGVYPQIPIKRVLF